MLSPRLDSLGVRPLETERFLAEAEAQFARDDGFQAKVAPEGDRRRRRLSARKPACGRRS
jgi:hypothetical protein